MATITAPDLAEMRRTAAEVARAKSIPIVWLKTHFNNAIQAIEDAMTAGNVGANTVKQHVGAAIETAAPGVFSSTHKEYLFAIWCLRHAYRTGVL